MKLTAERMAQMRAREQAATPGDWQAHVSEGWLDTEGESVGEYDEEKDTYYYPPAKVGWWIAGLGWILGEESSYFNEGDASFVAHARQDLPDLLALADRAADVDGLIKVIADALALSPNSARQRNYARSAGAVLGKLVSAWLLGGTDGRG